MLSRNLFRLFTILITLIALIYPPDVSSSSEVNISVNSVISYSIDKEGDLNSNIRLNLVNNDSSPTIVKLYTVRIPFTGVADFSARQFGANIKSTINLKSDRTDITLDLNDEPLYGGNTLELALNFKVKDFLTSETDLSQVDFPINIDGTVSDRVIIQFESSWGDLKYVLGAGSTISKNDSYTTVILDSPTSYNATLVFNEISSYSFKIEKRLENTGDIEIVSEISLPRSQHNQRVTFDKISPSPDLAYQDDSQNMLLAYKVAPGHYIDLQIEGDLAYVSGNEQTLVFPEINKYLESSGFWEISSESGLNRFDTYLRANNLRIASTEKNIRESLSLEERDRFYLLTYQFVLNQLQYSEENIVQIQTAGRMSAENSISGSNTASLEDYSDLMIGLLREYGVPSRMAIGYVTNATEQYEEPFIHNWVEYWDSESGWHSSDPGLAEVTSSNLHDMYPLDHVSFLARTTSSNLPNLQYYDRDHIVFDAVEIGTAPNLSLEIQSDFEKTNQLNVNSTGTITVSNYGNTVIESLNISESRTSESVSLKATEIIVPGQTIELPFSIVLGQSQLEELADNKIKLTFAVAAMSMEDNSFNDVHETDLVVSTFWWWEVLLHTFSTAIFIGGFIIAYNIYRRWSRSESILFKLIEGIK